MQEAIVIGSGMLGGKTTGFFKGKNYLERPEVKSGAPELSARVKFPGTACITTEIFQNFVRDNNLGPLIQQHKCKEETAYDILRGHFLYGKFSNETLDAFRDILFEMDYPLAVRSSSKLEDRQGTSFAGKYETIFISNRGTMDQRLEQFSLAVKEVYASTYNPSALRYRSKHATLEENEEMAILVHQAIGREYQGLFLPLMAGVGFSKNDYLWNGEIKKEDGIVRLVFGLGTRAVGRGYARIFSPGRPASRPEGSDPKAIAKFSQGIVDVLDIKENKLKQVRFNELVKDGCNCYPRAQRLFSLKDLNHLYTPSTNMWNKEHTPVLTFDGILSSSWLGLDLPETMKWLFRELETCFSCPVDIEFAIRVDDDPEEAHLYLVQCRPLSQREDQKPEILPDIPKERQIFFADRLVPTARLSGVEYIIYVDPHVYKNWPAADKFAVARVIGKLTQSLEGKSFILMGPGRWGSVNPELGVAIKYAEIANAKMLVEVAIRDAEYLPEVSYGTHFFQDLIEDKIVYTPLYPDEEGAFLNSEFFRKKNAMMDILQDEYYAKYDEVVRVVHVPTVACGKFAEVVFNGIEDKGVVYTE